MAARKRHHDAVKLAVLPRGSTALAIENRGCGETLSILAEDRRVIREENLPFCTSEIPGSPEPQAKNHFSFPPRSADEPGNDAPVDLSTPQIDGAELHLLVDFFLLLQKWDDILQSKRTSAGTLPLGREIAA